MVRSMTNINRVKPKGLHYDLIFLDEFTIQMIHIYRGVRRVQKGMKEYQIKSELNVFNSDLIIINYNQISYILLPYLTTIMWKIYYMLNMFPVPAQGHTLHLLWKRLLHIIIRADMGTNFKFLFFIFTRKPSKAGPHCIPTHVG